MARNGKWNGNFGIEYGRRQNRMEDFKNGMEDNFLTSIPIPYQISCNAFTEKHILYRCRVVINNIVAEVFRFNIYVHYLRLNCGTLIVFIMQTVYALHHIKYISICSIDGMVDDFDRFNFFCLVSRLKICQVVHFFFFHTHESLYLLFHPRFNSFLFIYTFSF